MGITREMECAIAWKEMLKAEFKSKSDKSPATLPSYVGTALTEKKGGQVCCGN